MEASVQYNDFRGTTAADRSDYLVDRPNLVQHIIDRFDLPIDADNYEFVGLSVYTTDVTKSAVSFILRNRQTGDKVRIRKYSVQLQEVLNLFKRFEFQIGIHLNEIDENDINDINIEE